MKISKIRIFKIVGISGIAIYFLIMGIENVRKFKLSTPVDITGGTSGEYLDLFQKDSLSKLNVQTSFNRKNNYPISTFFYK